MPRQIPLKRARGGGEDALEGCSSTYLKGIVAIIALIVVGAFCQMAYEAGGFLVSVFLIVAGIWIVVFAIQERAQITLWLESVEKQIEQWAGNEKRFVIAIVAFSILICLIFSVLGIIVLLKR